MKSWINRLSRKKRVTWKDLDSLRKGILIGFLLGLIILILTFLPVPYISELNPITWLIENCKETKCFSLLLITPLFYLLVGGFIGWLVGK